MAEQNETKSEAPAKPKTAAKSKKKGIAPKAALRTEGDAKPAAEEVDEFVAGANRWAERLKPHIFKIAALVVLITAVGIGWQVYSWMNGRKAMKSTTAYAEASAIARRLILTPDETPDPATDPSASEDPAKDTFPDRESRAQATLTALVGAERLTGPAALLRAEALMDLGKFDDAAIAYADAAKDLPREAAIEARAGIGYAYEAKAEKEADATAREKTLANAIEAFRAMQPAEDGPSHDIAMFHVARLLAVLGRRDEAVSAYQKLLEVHPESRLKTEVEARLEAFGID